MSETIFTPGECEVVALAPLATIHDDGIIRRTLLAVEGGKVIMFSLDGGQDIAEHTNPNHALIQVLTGSLNLVLDGKRRVLSPGEILHMPPRFPHALRANGATSFLLTLLAPAR